MRRLSSGRTGLSWPAFTLLVTFALAFTFLSFLALTIFKITYGSSFGVALVLAVSDLKAI